MKNTNGNNPSNPDQDPTTLNTQDHATRTWEPEELEHVLETLTTDLQDDSKNPQEVFAQAAELQIPIKELGMLIGYVKQSREVWLPWITTLKAQGWQTSELRALYRFLCFEQLDYDQRPSLNNDWVKAYLLDFSRYGKEGELEELFDEDDQSTFVEFVRAAVIEMPEDFEAVLDNVLRFRSRPLKLRPGERREPLTCRDAELFKGLVPWLSFEQREDIRWAIVRNLSVVRSIDRFFAQFSKDQQFATGKLRSCPENAAFAGRMLLEYFYGFTNVSGSAYFERLIERALHGPNDQGLFCSRLPDVYRALLLMGNQGHGKPNSWLTSELEKWWQKSVMPSSGWLILTLTPHTSEKSGRVNLQATAPSDLRIHGFPPKLVMSIPAEREMSEILHRVSLGDGRSLVLHAGDRVMVQRDFYRSTVAHRTHDTAIFHGKVTNRRWSYDRPWPTDVMIPIMPI